MKNIVLLTRKNNKKTTHVSVCLYDNFVEAQLFCNFINNIKLENNEIFVAATAIMNMEYSLEKWEALSFDDFIKAENSIIQRVLQETDTTLLVHSLKNEKEESIERIFSNISKYAASMLREDMEFIDTIDEMEIEMARRKILSIYSSIIAVRNNELITTCENIKKRSNKRKPETIEKEDNLVLILRGCGDVVENVTISLFDSYGLADDFCHMINELKIGKNNFLYARHVEQMIEYETKKPLLVQFDQIFELEKLFGKYQTIKIFREALKKFSKNTLLVAFKRLDKNSREKIMQYLPIKTADSINCEINSSDKRNNEIITLSDTRIARQKIINAINRTVNKIKNIHVEPILKD